MRLPGWTDRTSRQSTTISAAVELPDGRLVPVTIVNISRDGCRVQCGESLPIAKVLHLLAGGHKVEVDVRWALEGAAGLRLLRPAHAEKAC